MSAPNPKWFAPAYLGGSNKLRAYLFFIYDKYTKFNADMYSVPEILVWIQVYVQIARILLGFSLGVCIEWP